ncbi:MAG: hypothetical protein KIT76_17185 [Pseudolabrys sp.]|nr:hypothetical protein [Pseudolabrys sp.]
MRRLWVLAAVVLAVSMPSRAQAQGSMNWYTALPKESIETIYFRDCQISVRFGCSWTFQNHTWLVYFPEDRIPARKIDGYYKQINFENLLCVSPGLKAVRCQIISIPFDRVHLLQIDPQSADAGQQTWRIAAPVAVRYDR